MTSALCAGFAIISLASLLVPVASARKLDSRSKLTTPLSGQIGLAASSLVLFHMAMFMGSIALPIVTTHDLRGTKADVGLIFSVCASLEVLVMFTFVIRPSKAGSRRWISFGFLAFMLYFLVAAWSSSVAVILGAQVLRLERGLSALGYRSMFIACALLSGLGLLLLYFQPAAR
jgi:SET family sugar efflux transporter-like MFS transporter